MDSNNDSLRAADVDRDRVVEALREQAAVGRIGMDEFDERMTAAYAAKTWADLRALVRDLPVDITFDGERRERPRPASAPEPRVRPVRVARGPVHPLHLAAMIGLAIAVANGVVGAILPLVILSLLFAGRIAGRGRCGAHRPR